MDMVCWTRQSFLIGEIVPCQYVAMDNEDQVSCLMAYCGCRSVAALSTQNMYHLQGPVMGCG